MGSRLRRTEEKRVGKVIGTYERLSLTFVFLTHTRSDRSGPVTHRDPAKDQAQEHVRGVAETTGRDADASPESLLRTRAANNRSTIVRSHEYGFGIFRHRPEVVSHAFVIFSCSTHTTSKASCGDANQPSVSDLHQHLKTSLRLLR